MQAFDGKAKWYSERELAAFTGANPSKVVLMQAALRGDRYVHWERKAPTRPDGSAGYI